jgi:hypothetical protein
MPAAFYTDKLDAESMQPIGVPGIVVSWNGW